MKKNIERMKILFFLTSLCVFIYPVFSIAGGGDFQSKIKGKIGSSRNIQYNLDAVNEVSQNAEVAYPQSPLVASSGSGTEAFRGVGGTQSDLKDYDIAKKPRKDEGRADSASIPILSSYAIYKADYKAEIDEDVATVNGKVFFEVFKKGWTQIPLLRSNVGLIDVSVNRGTSFVTMQGGKYYLMIERPGKYNLDIEFLVKASRERENGPGNFSFEVMPAPISQFEFTMLESGVDIFVEPSIRLEVKKEASRTIAWAVMPNTPLLTVRWTKALPKEEIVPVKLEPKVYADTATYASVGDGLIRCQTTLNYSILQSEISSIRIALPEDVSILEVRGNDLRDWKVSTKEGQQSLDVYLNFGIKGNYILYLNYERKISEGSGVVEIPWVRAHGIEREKGYFGVAAATNVELAVNKIEHASLIDVKELPSTIWGSTTNPILLAFKYLNHPFSIAIEVTKHEELPVLVAAIDSAGYTTLLTDEGKSLTKAIYQVRNNVKQFLYLVLPKNATLWSAFVAGKPVKPAKDKNGNMLIPLEKSQLSGESLAQFPVEIVYLDKTSKMKLLGSLALHLPYTDIPVSSLSWSLYLPLDYGYVHFGGDVKESERALGIGRKFGEVVQMKEAADQLVSVGVYRRKAAQEEQRAWNVPQQEFSSVKGVLPIKIDIPEQGRLYQFSKLLVTEKESPWLSIWFVYGVKQAQGFVRLVIKLLIFLAIFFVVLRFVKKITKKVA